MNKLLIVMTLCFGLVSFGGLQAQTSGGSVTITPLKVDGLVVGSRYVIDQAFAEKFNIAVPVPFSFVAPRNEAQKIYRKEAPGGSGIIKLFFTTQDDQVQSHIQFVPFTIDQMPVDKRLGALQGLVKKAFLSSIKDQDAARVNQFQKINIGKQPALEMIGNYKDPADGTLVRRIVAIPDPDSRNGVMVIIVGLAKNLKMKKAEDILAVSASRALGTFRFLK